MESTKGPEHFIEFVEIPTWQADSIHLAHCACGWQSQRITDREVVDTEAQRHLDAQGEP